MSRIHAPALLLLGLLAVTGSCRPRENSKSSADTPTRPSTTQRIGEHWIQDERLRDVMADVSRRMRENYPSGLPDDPEQSAPPEIGRALVDAAKLADGLVKASERMPLAIKGNVAISDEDRAGFLREARTLRKHALQLSEAAGEWQIEGMQRSLQGINATCIACHSRYKDISGELDSSRTSAKRLGR
jgi:hypothetical protein